jgi:carbon storage regulator
LILWSLFSRRETIVLVLSRKQNEKVTIGDDVEVTVLAVRGGVVKLGIKAPPNVRILRGELPNWIAVPQARQQPAILERALVV